MGVASLPLLLLLLPLCCSPTKSSLPLVPPCYGQFCTLSSGDSYDAFVQINLIVTIAIDNDIKNMRRGSQSEFIERLLARGQC